MQTAALQAASEMRRRKPDPRLAKRLEQQKLKASLQQNAAPLGPTSAPLAAAGKGEKKGDDWELRMRERLMKKMDEEKQAAGIKRFACVECGQGVMRWSSGMFCCCRPCFKAWDNLRKEGWDAGVVCGGITAGDRAIRAVKRLKISKLEARRRVMAEFPKHFKATIVEPLFDGPESQTKKGSVDAEAEPTMKKGEEPAREDSSEEDEDEEEAEPEVEPKVESSTPLPKPERNYPQDHPEAVKVFPEKSSQQQSPLDQEEPPRFGAGAKAPTPMDEAARKTAADWNEKVEQAKEQNRKRREEDAKRQQKEQKALDSRRRREQEEKKLRKELEQKAMRAFELEQMRWAADMPDVNEENQGVDGYETWRETVQDKESLRREAEQEQQSSREAERERELKDMLRRAREETERMQRELEEKQRQLEAERVEARRREEAQKEEARQRREAEAAAREREAQEAKGGQQEASQRKTLEEQLKEAEEEEEKREQQRKQREEDERRRERRLNIEARRRRREWREEAQRLYGDDAARILEAEGFMQDGPEDEGEEEDEEEERAEAAKASQDEQAKATPAPESAADPPPAPSESPAPRAAASGASRLPKEAARAKMEEARQRILERAQARQAAAAGTRASDVGAAAAPPAAAAPKPAPEAAATGGEAARPTPASPMDEQERSRRLAEAKLRMQQRLRGPRRASDPAAEAAAPAAAAAASDASAAPAQKQLLTPAQREVAKRRLLEKRKAAAKAAAQAAAAAAAEAASPKLSPPRAAARAAGTGEEEVGLAEAVCSQARTAGAGEKEAGLAEARRHTEVGSSLAGTLAPYGRPWRLRPSIATWLRQLPFTEEEPTEFHPPEPAASSSSCAAQPSAAASAESTSAGTAAATGTSPQAVTEFFCMADSDSEPGYDGDSNFGLDFEDRDLEAEFACAEGMIDEQDLLEAGVPPEDWADYLFPGLHRHSEPAVLDLSKAYPGTADFDFYEPAILTITPTIRSPSHAEVLLKEPLETVIGTPPNQEPLLESDLHRAEEDWFLQEVPPLPRGEEVAEPESEAVEGCARRGSWRKAPSVITWLMPRRNVR